MNIEELNQVATVKDLQKFKESILDGVKELLYDKHTLGKEFFTPKEFSHLSGIKYSTVVYRCKVGKLKARQDDPNCSWQIDVSELERFKNEARTNTL
ncbi:MAG TPA: hypothetical protein VNX01_16380 [Bacteroidia bacterium]|jgi:hypothetical protein|nr:hypothetical protein [Bacteroidia bacterium]